MGSAQRVLEKEPGVIAGPCVDAYRVVDGPGLVRQSCKRSGEIGTAVVGNHNGSDMDILVN